MWFKESNSYFCKIENFANGEINERSFSNPHLCSWIRYIAGFITCAKGTCYCLGIHNGCGRDLALTRVGLNTMAVILQMTFSYCLKKNVFWLDFTEKGFDWRWWNSLESSGNKTLPEGTLINIDVALLLYQYARVGWMTWTKESVIYLT